VHGHSQQQHGPLRQCLEALQLRILGGAAAALPPQVHALHAEAQRVRPHHAHRLGKRRRWRRRPQCPVQRRFARRARAFLARTHNCQTHVAHMRVAPGCAQPHPHVQHRHHEPRQSRCPTAPGSYREREHARGRRGLERGVDLESGLHRAVRIARGEHAVVRLPHGHPVLARGGGCEHGPHVGFAIELPPEACPDAFGVKRGARRGGQFDPPPALFVRERAPVMGRRGRRHGPGPERERADAQLDARRGHQEGHTRLDAPAAGGVAADGSDTVVALRVGVGEAGAVDDADQVVVADVAGTSRRGALLRGRDVAPREAVLLQEAVGRASWGADAEHSGHRPGRRSCDRCQHRVRPIIAIGVPQLTRCQCVTGPRRYIVHRPSRAPGNPVRHPPTLMGKGKHKWGQGVRIRLVVGESNVADVCGEWHRVDTRVTSTARWWIRTPCPHSWGRGRGWGLTKSLRSKGGDGIRAVPPKTS
jgi:hypothetical protein